MRIIAILIGAIIVAGLDLAALVIGFVVWNLSGAANQIAVQLPVSYLAGIPLVLGWVRLWQRLLAASATQVVVLLAVAVPCGALVFTGAHYALSGYLTSYANILWLWFFQLTANLPALLVVTRTARRRLRR